MPFLPITPPHPNKIFKKNVTLNSSSNAEELEQQLLW